MIALILAASPCGAVWSCDAIFSAWKRADRAIISPPGPSFVYTIPLRFVQILLGVIYFFPGFWKIWTSGVDWIFSDNLKFHLYSKWSEFSGWTPLFRIDSYPILYKLAAMASVAFEMSFIFLIFCPFIYILAPLGGVIFHQMTGLFMRIHFSLYNYYIVFFDLHSIFLEIGRWIYKTEMYLIYDGSCKLCRRTIASIRVFDIFERVTYLEAQDTEARAAHGLLWLDPAALMVDMHAIQSGNTYLGFSAYRVLASRIPLFWLVLPLLYIWPIPTIGRQIYRRIATSRACNIATRVASHDNEVCPPRQTAYAVIVVGTALVIGNVFYGIANISASWPLACYPTFAAVIKTPKMESIEMVVLNAVGEEIAINKDTANQKFSSERWRGLISRTLRINDPAQRSTRLKALWRVWGQSNHSLQGAATVQFYKVTLSTIPERRQENPLKRELILEITP